MAIVTTPPEVGKTLGTVAGRWICVCLLLVPICSCGRPSADDLPGRYRVDYTFGYELLVLKPDGEYTQLLTLGDGPSTITVNGKWLYDRQAREIVLENHLVAHDGYCGPNPKVRDPSNRWRTVLDVTKQVGGKIEIVASADGAGCDYKRID